MTYEPHPYALMLPALTDEEYAALKADIAEHGILYPVIVDEDDQVLDGVHRVRIAAELGIDPPISRHTGLGDLSSAERLGRRARYRDVECRRGTPAPGWRGANWGAGLSGPPVAVGRVRPARGR